MAETKTGTITIIKTCWSCGQQSEVTMPRDAYEQWKDGEFIQVAWPEATADERETVMTGLHGPCYDALADDLESDEREPADCEFISIRLTEDDPYDPDA